MSYGVKDIVLVNEDIFTNNNKSIKAFHLANVNNYGDLHSTLFIMEITKSS